MGDLELRLLFALEERGVSVFSAGEAAALLNRSGPSLRKTLFRLCRKGRLTRLKRGVYLLVPAKAGLSGGWMEHSLIIGAHLASPYYIGFWNALNFHALTEQVPVTVSVVTKKRLKSRTVLSTGYNFITVPRKQFFGFEKKEVAGSTILVSDPEKTIVDCLGRPGECGGLPEVAKALRSGALDFERLVSYAERVGNGVVFKRLGYLLELFNEDLPESLWKRIRKGVRNGYTPLEPLLPAKGRHSSRWQLVINIDKRKLLAARA